MTHSPHITNYEILTECEPSLLSTKIEAAIHKGWQPFGHLAVANQETDDGGKTITYSQAVVKQSEWYR